MAKIVILNAIHIRNGILKALIMERYDININPDLSITTLNVY